MVSIFLSVDFAQATWIDCILSVSGELSATDYGDGILFSLCDLSMTMDQVLISYSGSLSVTTSASIIQYVSGCTIGGDFNGFSGFFSFFISLNIFSQPLAELFDPKKYFIKF